jgi:N-acetylated-alpha-linked acidic dipeptidase
VQGLVDFSPARTALDELDAALGRFRAHVSRVEALPAGDAVTRRTNRALRRLARLLVPVNYTRGPEFFHDPAETTPALPDLAPALQAAEMSDWDRGFLATHLVRGQNRLVAALRDSRATLEAVMEAGR